MRRLSQKQIHTCIELLKDAKLMIVFGQEHYICYAIERIGYADKSTKSKGEMSDYLTDWIQHQLGNMNVTLEGWLVTKKYVKHYRVFLSRPPIKDTKLINTRCNWIDWMVKQLQKELK